MGPDQVVVRSDGEIAAVLQVEPIGNEGYRHISFAPYSKGWLTSFDFMGPTAVRVASDGTMGASLGEGPYHVFSRADRSELVFSFTPWNDTRTVVSVLGPSGLHRVRTAESVAGFLGEHQVVVTGQRRGVYRVDLRDGSTTPVPGPDRAVMVSSRSATLIGVSDDEEGQPGYGVYDARTGSPVLGAPGYRLAGFSPSGRHVVGYQLNSGPPLLVLAEVASGTVVQAFRLRGPGWWTEDPALWEDDHTLLHASFVRFGLDGTVERTKVLQPPGCCPYLLPPPVS